MGEGNGEAREAAVLLVCESSDKEKDYGEVVLEGNGGGVQEVIIAGSPARKGRQRGSGTARGVVAKLIRESLDKGKGWREELIVGRGGACKKAHRRRCCLLFVKTMAPSGRGGQLENA
jgi:hypothetical protein